MNSWSQGLILESVFDYNCIHTTLSLAQGLPWPSKIEPHD